MIRERTIAFPLTVSIGYRFTVTYPGPRAYLFCGFYFPKKLQSLQAELGLLFSFSASPDRPQSLVGKNGSGQGWEARG